MWRIEILLKRAYEKVGTEDCFRVLVDRLWPRGKKKAAFGCMGKGHRAQHRITEMVWSRSEAVARILQAI